MARTSDLPRLRLDGDRLSRGPWVYARQVEKPSEPVSPGALVEVYDASDRFIGHALYNGYSDVRLRWLSRGRKSALRQPREFLRGLLKRADDLRRRTLRLEAVTDAYRIAHGEGDDLPGLIVDRLGPALVVEHHARGFWELREEVDWALGQLYPGSPVVHKVPTSARRAENFPDDVPEVWCADGREAPSEVEVREHGLRFPVAPGRGHKTGFFCDQRDNRVQLGQWARDRRVLDLCCNTGGFALHAARAGAREVLAVDLDEVVLERARGAARLNGLERAIEFRHQDTFATLREDDQRERHDLVILDPPKLANSQRDAESALRKYSDWNTLALGAIQPGGLLATFSCSGAVDAGAFLGTVFGAARRADRRVRLIAQLGPGPDHPQSPDFTRSRYLKGAVLAVGGAGSGA
jgi:23S rRNA (cytosine1962-C5)-methyltransferase